MIEKKRLQKPYRKNLIGKNAKIEYQKKIFDGEIVFETKNTIKLKTKDKVITIIKQNSKITIDNNKINGKTITKRIEDRIKLR